MDIFRLCSQLFSSAPLKASVFTVTRGGRDRDHPTPLCNEASFQRGKNTFSQPEASAGFSSFPILPPAPHTHGGCCHATEVARWKSWDADVFIISSIFQSWLQISSVCTIKNNRKQNSPRPNQFKQNPQQSKDGEISDSLCFFQMEQPKLQTIQAHSLGVSEQLIKFLYPLIPWSALNDGVHKVCALC